MYGVQVSLLDEAESSLGLFYLMATNLPYFKFYCAEWNDGSITLQSLSVQGLFINLCSHYWSKSGKLSLSEIKQRLYKATDDDFATLIAKNLIVINDDTIVIKFLDKQLQERLKISEKNSISGSLGGRGNKREDKEIKSERKANAKQTPSERQANVKPREEKSREEKRREDTLTETVSENTHTNNGKAIEEKSQALRFGDPSNSQYFFSIKPKYVHDSWVEIFGVEGLANFINSKRGALANATPELAESFMKKYHGQEFNEYSHLINCWRKFIS